MLSQYFFAHTKRVLIYGAVVIFAFSLLLFLARSVSQNSYLKEFVSGYGYFGVFLVSVLSGFNLIIPVPAASFVPLFVEAGLSLWVTIFIIALGTTVADILAYSIGIIGRHVTSELPQSKVVARLDKMRERWQWGPIVALFLFVVFIPFPNEIILIPLGFMGYHLRLILPVVFFGSAIFNIAAAFGALGLFNLL